MAASMFFLILVLGVSRGEPPYKHGLDPVVGERLGRVERLLLEQDRRLQLLEDEKRQLQDSVTNLSHENHRLKNTVANLCSDDSRKTCHTVLLHDNHELKETAALMISGNQKLQSEQAFIKAEYLELKRHIVKCSGETEVLKSGITKLNRKMEMMETSLKLQPPLIAPKTPLDLGDVEKGAALHGVSPRADDTDPLGPVVSQMAQRLTEVSSEVEAIKNSRHQQDAAIQEAGSSVYVRWGNSACPNSTSLVYSGVVGGSHFTHSGAAANYLSLTLSPVFSDHAIPDVDAFVYGGEYQTKDSHMDKDPVCAVCRSQHATTIMVPGTNACLPGWSLEYSGYLMAGYYDHPAASEFICVDSNLESELSSNVNEDGKLLYYTVTRCGSLPCEPYIDNKIVTCAVCSK